jgi:hypothetical protein
MDTFFKILSSILILVSVYMGIKHGWGMLTAKPAMLEMFGKWNVTKNGVVILGGIGLIATLLILFPITFLWGNLITACVILFIIANMLNIGDLKGVLIELPFLIIPMVMIYLQHPLARMAVK